MKRAAISCLALLFLVLTGAACTSTDGTDESGDPLASALAHEDRPQEDRDQDDNRRPQAVLEFFGLEAGMSVLDMFSSGGYYTEILSRVVGPEGEVFAHNNEAYRAYAADAIAKRHSNTRLPNVSRLDIEVDELDLEAGSLDMALLVLAYHDIYYKPADGSWPDIDGPAMLAQIYEGLRPGSVLGVVDHEAQSAAVLVETATTLHRIDKQRVREQIESAGFVMEAESDILDNPADDLTRGVFVEGVRGKTDRFVYRFRKPK